MGGRLGGVVGGVVDEVDDGSRGVRVGGVPGDREQGEPGAGDQRGEPWGLPGADDVQGALRDDDRAVDPVQPGGDVEHDRVPQG